MVGSDCQETHYLICKLYTTANNMNDKRNIY